MAEETVVQEIPIGTVDMATYKQARKDGVLTVPQKAAEVEEVEKDDESTEEDEPKEAKADGDPEKPKSKGGGFQKRIDRLMKQTFTLEEQNAELKKQLEAKTAVPKTEQAAPKVEGEPQRQDFSSEVDYVRALTRWEVKLELKEQREAEVRAEQESKQREAYDAYNKKAIEAESRHDDWKEVVSQPLEIPAIVGDAIVNTIENGPEVAYFLGKHPDVAKQMLEAHPLKAVQMAIEIGRELAGGESEDEEAEPVKAKADEKPMPRNSEGKFVSKAPAPIKPVGGGSTKSSVPLDQMSISEYKKARAQGRVQ